MDRKLLKEWDESLPDNFDEVLEGRLLAESERWLQTCHLSAEAKSNIHQRLMQKRQELMKAA
ncbi:MAG: hypothetical protein PHD51_01345 [Patescibacteria group bacterium]|nr:hypothetical protein [Patescibacteria group bacterium]MDD5490494.1 hypothetical protein [Patescibacteria group bacterium]